MEKTPLEQVMSEVFATGREMLRRNTGDVMIGNQEGEWIVSWHQNAHWNPIAVAHDTDLVTALKKLKAELIEKPLGKTPR
jgi:hypothetical protein